MFKTGFMAPEMTCPFEQHTSLSQEQRLLAQTQSLSLSQVALRTASQPDQQQVPAVEPVQPAGRWATTRDNASAMTHTVRVP